MCVEVGAPGAIRHGTAVIIAQSDAIRERAGLDTESRPRASSMGEEGQKSPRPRWDADRTWAGARLGHGRLASMTPGRMQRPDLDRGQQLQQSRSSFGLEDPFDSDHGGRAKG